MATDSIPTTTDKIILEWLQYISNAKFSLSLLQSFITAKKPLSKKQFNNILALLDDSGLLDWLDGSPQDAISFRPSLDALAAALGVQDV